MIKNASRSLKIKKKNNYFKSSVIREDIGTYLKLTKV